MKAWSNPTRSTTSKPAFNATNSVSAGDSKLLVRFVEAWEASLPAESSPRELITDGARVHELDGIVIVEETRNGSADYYAVGLLGNRPVLCLVHDEKMDVIAERHGVQIEIKREDESDSTPAMMNADGTEEALYAFVIDAFTNGMLACQAPTELTGGL